MSLVFSLPHGEPAFRALQVAIQSAKRDDPLAPVTVITPSNYAGLSLRRELGHQGPVVNVRFLVLARLSELLGAPRLAANQRPLTPLRRSEAIRAALVGHRGVFAAVAGHPATESALDATFQDLRLASPVALDRVSQASQRGADAVALFRRFRRLSAGTFDLDDLAVAAAQAVTDTSAALSDLGRMVFFLPRTLGPGEQALVRALLERDHADLIGGLTYDAQADASHADLFASVGARAPAEVYEGAVTTGTHVIRTMDQEEEVRSVIRFILGAAENGTPLHRTAVLFPPSSDYPSLLREQFASANIPVNGPPIGGLADSLPGRVLTRLLRLRAAGYRRDDVMDFLTSGPILESSQSLESINHRRVVPASIWDETSRDAGIVSGPGHWNGRLAAWANDSRRRPGEAEAAVTLSTFVRELQVRLSLPRERTLSAFARWALGLLDRYLGSESAAASWGVEAEAAAYIEVRQQLDVMASMEPFRDPDTGELLPALGGLNEQDAAAAFGERVDRALKAAMGHLGSFGSGVFIGPLPVARAMAFDRVFILGMVDGAMPPASHEDPIIPDEEREDAGLITQATLRTRARENFLAALATAPQRVLCFPQSSLRAQAEYLPSRWLLETASALAGQAVSSLDFEAIRAEPWLTSVESFEQAIASNPTPAASLQEWEMRSLRECDARSHFLAQEQPFAASLAAMSLRLPPWARRHALDMAELSPWAGGVGTGFVIDSTQVYSPTSFETLANCGFRYFLSHVGRVKETQRPELTLRISGADRGNLMHDVLERFFTENSEAGRLPAPDQPWTADDFAHLQEIASEECDRAQARGITGSELLWRVDRARILRDLSLFLESDATFRSRAQSRFIAAEHVFGDLDLDPGVERWPAVELEIEPGRTVRFRGRIDRVDRAADDRLIVYDYKSGSSSPFKDLARGRGNESLGRGRHLQLPIYALAARTALGDAATQGEAYYWFTSERERFNRIGGPIDASVEAALKGTLGVLARMAESGLFPPVPGQARTNAGRKNTFANCSYCPYDRVCAGGDRVRSWAERKGAIALADYVALVDIPAEKPAEDSNID